MPAAAKRMVRRASCLSTSLPVLLICCGLAVAGCDGSAGSDGPCENLDCDAITETATYCHGDSISYCAEDIHCTGLGRRTTAGCEGFCMTQGSIEGRQVELVHCGSTSSPAPDDQPGHCVCRDVDTGELIDAWPWPIY